MKKNNTADFTQFELFDENMNVFEIVAESEKGRNPFTGSGHSFLHH